MRAGHRLVVSLGLGVWGQLAAASALAEEAPAQNKKVATDLFDSGVEKMEAGGCDTAPVTDAKLCEEAREAFARAHALYPAGLGALRNLAYVEKNLGLVASSARNFRELARQAPLDPKPARRLWAGFAQEEIVALEPRIPHLTVFVSDPPPGVALTLDGQPLPKAAWEAALDVDPGTHVLRATAPDHEAFEQTLDIAEAEEKELTVVLDERQPAAAQTTTPIAAPPERDSASAPSRLGPWIVMGAGAATLGAGLGMGYVAIKKRQSACGNSRFCEPKELEAGRSIARAATFVTVGGAALAAGGLLWFFLTPGDADKESAVRVAPAAVPGGASFQASGMF